MLGQLITGGLGALAGVLGGGGDQTQTTEQTATPWEEQIPYLLDLFGGAQDWFNNGGMQAYDGQMVADQNANVTGGQQAMLDAAGGIGSELIGGANEAWNFALTNAMDPNSNPYLRNTVDAATGQIASTFNEKILPNMRLQSIAGNNFNSSRSALAEGQAAGEVGRAISGVTANMYSNAYNTGIGTMMQALGMAPEMFNLNLAPGQVQAGIGANQQAYDQALIDAQRQQFLEQQAAPLQNLQAYQGLISGNYGGTTTGTTTTPGVNPFMGALGGASAGLGLYNMFNTGGGGGGGAITPGSSVSRPPLTTYTTPTGVAAPATTGGAPW